ncbi:MAG: hypothetical protein A2Y62_07890 [Candidatus Fischerbacteria bacterium RBG_13_37_8]|uniref:DUF6677 domain-containing protein n=1 Tax=Candidatus Fischerbacteria bacterium RBG_13_37_8 TaxID=1817863 RepID=A0A1F5V956_9BACT|nr:MAG: hypothetical protein A2Y62_07890 [Candidatus Fischerbacteria bacterium RBG_13_37_8]
MNDTNNTKKDDEIKKPVVKKTVIAALIISGWLIPGLGHLLQKKYGRAAIIFLIINFLFLFGLFGLKGKLYAQEPGNPISIFAALGQKGVGVPYFIIKGKAAHEEKEKPFDSFYTINKDYTLRDGMPASPFYEYGVTFTVSAGLLNLLLLFDIFDIATGRKK